MTQENQIQRVAKEPTLKDLVASNIIQQKLAKVAGKHFDHERFSQAVLIMVNKSRDLQECTPTSLLDCMMVAAQQNWTIGGPRPGMYIVKYGNTATPIPSYFGFQETARDSDQEWEIEAAVVRDGDEFRYCRGLAPILEHRPHDDEEASITHAYAIARSKTGRVKFEVMNIDAIEAIRARSRAAQKGPWVSDYAEMCKKTVVRRLCKYLPSSPKMDAALEISDRGDDIEVVSREVPPPRMNLRQQAKSSLPDGATAPANASSSTPQGPAPENEPQAQAGPSSESNATGTTGEAREKQAGAVDAQAASTPPKVSGRPKAKQERQHEPSMGVKEAEGVPPETIADAYAKETDIETLKNWMMKLNPKVRQSALETAGITTLVDAKEEDVRNAAYIAKLSSLTNPK